jgi:hypothetical protein
LKSFSSEKLTFQDAQKIVSNAKVLREQVFQEVAQLFPQISSKNFRGLLFFLLEKKKEYESKPEPAGFSILIAKCNILETLLLKYFKSEKDFESMIAAGEKELD